jgi:hypothetical protein
MPHGTPPITRKCWLPFFDRVLLEEDDRPRRTVKEIRRVPKNRNLTDALTQQRPKHPDEEG